MYSLYILRSTIPQPQAQNKPQDPTEIKEVTCPKVPGLELTLSAMQRDPSPITRTPFI